MRSNWAARVAVNETLAREQLQNYLEFTRLVVDHSTIEENLKNLLRGKIRARDIKGLLDAADSIAGTEYPSATMHYVANQIAYLFKKVPFESSLSGLDPEGEALKKFRATERRVGRYNLRQRLRRKLKRYGPDLSLTHDCAVWIERVLGEQPRYKEIWRECGFGPGASVGVSGNATHFAAKYLSQGWSVTQSALQYALAAFRSDPGSWEVLLKTEESPFFCWDPEQYAQVFADKCSIVDYNKIALVPKTAKVHRTIAVEPLLNGYLQNGVDKVMRRRLRSVGIDLTSQDRNRELARQGSLPGEDPYVTIDLSEASDSISRELCQDLLPRAWYLFLSSIRSPSYILEGEKYAYEKFCSMGNGFCFPLETLIFSSVCHVVYKRHHRSPDFSVYGDDIIVRQSLAQEVLAGLKSFGFRHNPEKTFLTGPFRESCGADWYNGEDVRPVTVNAFPDSIEKVFTLHNKTLRSERTTALFTEAREFLRALLPLKLRFVRPYKGNDNTAFQVDRDLFMASPHALWNRATWSWEWKELVVYALSDKAYDEDHRYPAVLLQAALRGSKSEAPFTKRRNTRTGVRKVSHHGGHSTWLPSYLGMHSPR